MVKNDLLVREKTARVTAKPLIIAHRGSSILAPENTLAAFRRAIDDGADGIEFDVRLAKDNVAVVFHDETLNRTARREGLVSDFASSELREFDIGSWFNEVSRKSADPEFAKERISTLTDVLAFLKDFRGLIYVELKCRDSEIVRLAKAVCLAIENSGLAGRIIVKSFKLAVIPHVRMFCPAARTAALFAPKMRTILRKEKHLVKIAEEFGADEISIHFSLATQKLMKKAEQRNLPVTIWTADSPRWIKRGIKLGLNAIITNNPAPLLAKRGEILKGSEFKL
ncbi:MAG: glycerophosphodiester phosphodiesterase family protein [Pyrinomonadaceae bacterium]